MRKLRFAALLALLALGAGFYFSRPCVFIVAPHRTAIIPAAAGMPLKIAFNHSVQKTPVEEFLAVNEAVDGFVLRATRYRSFGVGLPFLAAEGNFRTEGEYFVLDGMERRYPSLSLRPGVGTRLTVTAGGREYRLYEDMPLGSRVDIFVAPRYEQWRERKDD